MGIKNTKEHKPLWIQHNNLPNQSLAISDYYSKKLVILNLKSGTSRICSANISDHECLGIVTINDEVYAVTKKEILKVHGDGSVTTLQLLEGFERFSQVVAFQKKIYIIQPNDEHLLCFDPCNNSFNDTLLGCGLGVWFCASSSHNFIFSMGGDGTKKSAMKFDPLENTWTQIASMTTGRHSAAAACMEDRIYVAGGQDEMCRANKSAEFYSPDDNIWTRIPNMNISRFRFNICVIGNQLYAIGGFTNAPEYSVEVYDGNQWMMVTEFEHEYWSIYACIWPHSLPVTSPGLTINENLTIRDSELNVNAGGEGSCMKIDKSITAGKYNAGHSQETSIGETNIAQQK